MTKKELGAAIRADIKTAGHDTKKISTRVRKAGHSTSVRVEVKDYTIDVRKVREIAEKYQKIRRCKYTDEILDGCNIYVFADYSDDAVKSEVEKHIDDAQKIFEMANMLAANTGRQIAQNDKINARLYISKMRVEGFYEVYVYQNDIEDRESTWRHIVHVSTIAEALASFNIHGNLIR